MIWLSPKTWLAAGLGLVLVWSHHHMYTMGKGVVQAKWDKETAQQIQAALKAEQAARAREQALVAQRLEMEKKYVDEKRRAAVAASNVRAELDRLRKQIEAARGPGASNSAATPGAVGAAPFSELFGQCAGALVDLGQEADRVKGIAKGLQDYVKNVCKN